VISSVDYADDLFQRVDDGDNAAAVESSAPRTRELIAARIESFVDDVDDNRLQSGSFERVSDDDSESESLASNVESEEIEIAEKASTKKSRVGKLLSSLGAKKRAPSKRSSTKKPATAVSEDAETADENNYADAEASLDDSGSRAEFATRRGGRRRRRPSKAGATEPTASDAPG